ncbi:MAG TPA: hypothetical protein VH396_17730 [Chitinophagaceae bacterium]|jgi:hypothetical protein
MEVFESVTFYIRHNGNRFEVKAIPYDEPDGQDIPLRFQIVIGEMPQGAIERKPDKWQSTDIKDKALLDVIVNNILKYYK